MTVKTMESEELLRRLAWVHSNRLKVERATGGRIGYIYIPDTGAQGKQDLFRQFMRQLGKEGLIIDERFNGGGDIPERFIELFSRRVMNYWAVRDGMDWQWPYTAVPGPKVMLINGRSSSGGDAFPYYFRQAGLGPLVGQRTLGGLIGTLGAPRLIDGGYVTVPTIAIYGDLLPLGAIPLQVLHTPGHTPGSVCLLTGTYLLAGDTLFPGGPGHTSSPDDFQLIIQSLTRRIFPLPDDTQVHPGHGDATVLGREKEAFRAFSARMNKPYLCGDVVWESS